MARAPLLDHPSTSIVIADCVARGHVNAGLHCHAELQRVYAETGRSGEPVNVQVVFSFAIPAISNLALGLEVFIKMHHFQNSGIYPNGHDIGVLATSFDSNVQEGLRHAYKMTQETALIKQAATLKFSVGEELSDLAALWPDDAVDLDEAALLIGRAYERWRYVYEELRTPLLATIAFKPLLAMVSTFDFAVQNFKSDAYVSIDTRAA